MISTLEERLGLMIFIGLGSLVLGHNSMLSITHSVSLILCIGVPLR